MLRCEADDADDAVRVACIHRFSSLATHANRSTRRPLDGWFSLEYMEA